MSRIGRHPITIPAGVEVKLDGKHVSVKGPKGTLELNYHPAMTVEMEGNTLLVKRPNDEKENRSLHGLTRSLINNMVVGVTRAIPRNCR
jgi:large subunit ribosomal protein L6